MPGRQRDGAVWRGVAVALGVGAVYVVVLGLDVVLLVVDRMQGDGPDPGWGGEEHRGTRGLLMISKRS